MRIDRLRLQSPDPGALADFYRSVFDARPCGAGVALGEERIAIMLRPNAARDAFAANETGFQHFALVVADIDVAYARLQSFTGWRPISLAGPERLPKTSGGAAAFKFRDPDGHPLELLQFAPESVSAAWKSRFAAAPERIFHGVAHTALTVRDLDLSADFYRRLGFATGRRQLNSGIEQARLDGISRLAEAKVAIASLSPADGDRPGVELLAYIEPPTVVRSASDRSAAATAIVIAGRTGEPDACDPDGHRLAFAAESPPAS